MALEIDDKVQVAAKPECFVIAPIGADKSDIRTRSDQILKHVIRPVADECGYNAVRADEISEPGAITTQVINRILEAPMVIADLTGNNANVFYELAIRHAIRKPYVQIVQKGERTPFDVAGIRTIEIDHTNLDSVAAAKEEIKKQMQFTAANTAKIQSPISVAIDLASLTQSDDPLKRQLAEVLTGLADLKTLIENRLTTPNEWRSIDNVLWGSGVTDYLPYLSMSDTEFRNALLRKVVRTVKSITKNDVDKSKDEASEPPASGTAQNK